VTDWQVGRTIRRTAPRRSTNPLTVSAKLNPPTRDGDAPRRPISAIVFADAAAVGASGIQARNWLHASWGRGASHPRPPPPLTGKVGVLRRDPMGDETFRDTNFGITVALNRCRHEAQVAAAIFHVNWFRQDAAGKFLWPGFGDNLRVLRMDDDRCKGAAKARDTASVNYRSARPWTRGGLELAPGALEELLAVDPPCARAEFGGLRIFR